MPSLSADCASSSSAVLSSAVGVLRPHMTSDLPARLFIFTGAWQCPADLIRQHAIAPIPRTLAIAETGTRVENRQVSTSAVIVRRRKVARTLSRLTFMSSADLRVNCVRNYIMSSLMASVRYAFSFSAFLCGIDKLKHIGQRPTAKAYWTKLQNL